MSNGADKEIEDMLENMASGGPVESEPPAEPPAEPPPEPPVEPVVEPPAEPPVEPPAEPPPVEPPAEPPAEPPVEPPEPPEPPAEPSFDEPLTEREKLLLERIEKLSGPVEPPVVAEPKPAEPKPGEPPPAEPPPAEPPKPAEVKIDEIDFLEGKDPNDLIDNPQDFNKLLNRVFMAGAQAAIPIAQERTLMSVPEIVISHVRRQVAFTKLVDDFYDVNQDLKPVRRTVQMIANEVHSENPDFTVDKVFAEAATRTRKVLGMPTPKPGEPTPPGVKPTDNPALVRARGSRQKPGGGKLTGVAKEIDDMLTFE